MKRTNYQLYGIRSCQFLNCIKYYVIRVANCIFQLMKQKHIIYVNNVYIINDDDLQQMRESIIICHIKYELLIMYHG
jgi:hypothetical protein